MKESTEERFLTVSCTARACIARDITRQHIERHTENNMISYRCLWACDHGRRKEAGEREREGRFPTRKQIDLVTAGCLRIE